MNINSIKWKNFKSYGNMMQEMTFSPDGELSLIVGANGNGKSALQNVIDYACYGQVKASNGKNAILSTLPNRINGDLYSEINFSTSAGDFHIERTMNPTRVKLVENGVTYPKAGKIQDKIEEHIGFDYNTYKSFISMSINDFKNFMSLPLEDKRKLLDRLFNLQVINAISKIIKALKSDNDNELISVDREIQTLMTSMSTIQESIDKLSIKKEIDIGNKLEELKGIILSKKGEFEKLNGALPKVVEAIKTRSADLSAAQTALNASRNEQTNLMRTIALYEKGKCPTCESDLTDESHTEHLASVREKYDAVSKLILTQQEKLEELSASLQKARDAERKYEIEITKLKTFLVQLKNQYNAEKQKSEEVQKDDSIVEFESALNKLGDTKKDADKRKAKTSEKKYLYERALEIFSENGVKQSIITNLVKPVNKFLQENLETLQMPFDVVLDENFDAKVLHLNEEIDPETLSTGETKKINLCIMLAYIKLIRLKRSINILFLDEIFSSVDMEGIYNLLEMLKQFSKEYGINIFLIHHSELNESYFDSIYSITKNVFSHIEKIK